MSDRAFSLPLNDLNLTRLTTHLDEPWYRTVAGNIRDALFPRKQPALQLTSKPVTVRSIWGEYDYKRRAGMGSMLVHAAMIGTLVWASVYTPKVVRKQRVSGPIVYIAPADMSQVFTPNGDDGKGGGGGGGDRDKIEASKGKLPKLSMQQLAPPAVVIRNENPKLAVEPTVVVPPGTKLPDSNIPHLGDPLSNNVNGPLSNGTGSGGGIGSGSGGGVGSGDGAGVGQGHGGGYGGGVFKVGGGVSAPKPLYTPDPEYTEEARRAKYEGAVILWLIVDADGQPRDIKVMRGLDMGLEQRAIEAVRNWKFEPSKKNGVPVAVQINVEVNFRLY